MVKFYNDPQTRTLRSKHQRSASFPLPAILGKLPPSVASFSTPIANEAHLIGDKIVKVFVVVLPDGSGHCKYPPSSFSFLGPARFTMHWLLRGVTVTGDCFVLLPGVFHATRDLAEEVWETFPVCYTAQKNEFILPLWRFHQKLGAKRLLNSL